MTRTILVLSSLLFACGDTGATSDGASGAAGAGGTMCMYGPPISDLTDAVCQSCITDNCCAEVSECLAGSDCIACLGAAVDPNVDELLVCTRESTDTLTRYLTCVQTQCITSCPQWQVAMEPETPPGPGICTDTCAFPFDGACDDGGPGAAFGACALGTDCSDCGPR